MKIFIMTDLEGVAGVLDFYNWIFPKSPFYDTGIRLLTAEINAAVRAFAENGFDEIIVCDAHGPGAVNIELLDKRTKILRGHPVEFGPYTGMPLCIDESFDALAFVGQHAKAGTEYSHLTHTGNMSMIDISVNGTSVGEYGQLVLCAGERGVPVIFASGEKALCIEAENLTPWVITAAVKEGVIPGTGIELSTEEYSVFHEGALHLHPDMAGKLIYSQATKAARLFSKKRKQFKPLTLSKPYEVVSKTRHSIEKKRPHRHTIKVKDNDLISRALNKAVDKVEKIIKA